MIRIACWNAKQVIGDVHTSQTLLGRFLGKNQSYTRAVGLIGFDRVGIVMDLKTQLGSGGNEPRIAVRKYVRIFAR